MRRGQRGCADPTEQQATYRGDARSFIAPLTSTMSPLGSMLNFDVNVMEMTARHQYENPLSFWPEPPQH